MVFKKGIPHSALLCKEEAFVRQKLCWILPAGGKILFFQERAPAFFPVARISGFYSDNPVQGGSHPLASEIDLEYLETFG